MSTAVEKTDYLKGTLQGEDFHGKCVVTLATKLTPSQHGYAGTTFLYITTADESLPDGIYHLKVHGRTFEVQRVGGQWPTLRL